MWEAGCVFYVTPLQAAGCKAKIPLLVKLAGLENRLLINLKLFVLWGGRFQLLLPQGWPPGLWQICRRQGRWGSHLFRYKIIWIHLLEPFLVFWEGTNPCEVSYPWLQKDEGWGTAFGSRLFTASHYCSAGVWGDWSSKCQQFPWTNAILLFQKARAQTMHHPAGPSNAAAEPSLLFAFNPRRNNKWCLSPAQRWKCSAKRLFSLRKSQMHSECLSFPC